MVVASSSKYVPLLLIFAVIACYSSLVKNQLHEVQNDGAASSSPTRWLGRRQLATLVGNREAYAADPPFNPRSFAYVLIHYHKTGHDLSRKLRDLLLEAKHRADGGLASNDRENTFMPRQHERDTGCPHALVLTPGMIHTQASPDFFCNPKILEKKLLRNDNMNGKVFKNKKGVKVIHLVRNPFTMSVSNLNYHAQFPTPENWVKNSDFDPCSREGWYKTQTLADLVASTLFIGEHPIMRHDDFEKLFQICTSIFHGKGQPDWTFHTHLRQGTPLDALALATAQLVGQARSGGDLLRMANNIIKFREVERLEEHVRTSAHLPSAPRDRMIQVLTLSMDDFIREPKKSAERFLNFALEDSVADTVKFGVAADYERQYREMVKQGGEHITHGHENDKIGNTEPLYQFLREDEVFGRILGNIENLVNDVIVESGGGSH
mmetsp:Transcript_7691/g.17964  ORF Transcript_7691/g.17964 Transcript_7691/m.17964 type:complete len:435 (-) Transcript_7691:350-1654(-)